jgi:hypothetical protein
MSYAFEVTRNSRNLLEGILDKYSLQQLNKIPQGFSNNIIWNVGHIIVVEQLLVYKLSGLSPMIFDEMILKYQKGSRPDGNATPEDLQEIKNMLFATIEKTQADFNAGIFQNYHEFTNSLGFTLRSAEEAISFNYFHEATHLGIIMSLIKFV